MGSPFLDFAKAYTRYMHALRPRKSVEARLSALRCLEAALTEGSDQPDATYATLFSFNRAAHLAYEQFAPLVAYPVGNQLELLCRMMAENRLLNTPVRWRNWISTPQEKYRLGRVGEKFDRHRSSKLPTEATLNALPQIFRSASEPRDIVTSSIGAILCASPNRIAELLTLPVDCEVSIKDSEGVERYGLRWWPAKGASPTVKWIIPSMVTVREAIQKIRLISAQARNIARWYEENPTAIYLPKEVEHFREYRQLTISEVARIVGFATPVNAIA
jgi:hypothetical protein